TRGGIEMSNFNFPITRSVYLVVLDKDLPSPLSPESDEEGGPGKAKKAEEPTKAAGEGKAKKRPAPKVRIDLEEIGQRIVALPLPARNYIHLAPGKEGVLFVTEVEHRPVAAAAGPPAPAKRTVYRFDLEKRKAEPFVEA